MADSKFDIILDELKQMRIGLQSMDTQFKEQSAQIHNISAQLTEWKQVSETAFNHLDAEIKGVKAEVAQCNGEHMMLKKELQFLQRSRAAKQIIVEGVPHLQNEPLTEILRNMFSCINFDPDKLFPSDAYRLGKFDPERERPPPILLEFHSNHARDVVMQHWREKKMLFADEIYPKSADFGKIDHVNIYMNKNYAPDIVAKLKEARQLKKHGFKIVYEYSDRVFVKKSFVDNPIEIKDNNTIQNLMSTNPLIK